MAEKMDEIPSNEENMDHNSPADVLPSEQMDEIPGNHEENRDQNSPYNSPENQNGQRPRGESVIFSYDELSNAISNCDSILGEGAFGSVHEGELQTEELVAVKKLGGDSKQGDKEFLKEVIMLSLLRHPNIISLIGFSAESPQQRLLVYELFPIGSLHDGLNELVSYPQILEWETRVAIALGTAKALSYLHNEAKPPVIHNDLKSDNILLDESFQPILSDFGLAEFDPTPPPNSAFSKEGYYASKIKKDVYDFGVVLFELITGIQVQEGQKPFAWLNSKMGNLDEAVDGRLKGKCNMASLGKAADVALACLHKNYHIRPDMRDVVRALSAI